LIALFSIFGRDSEQKFAQSLWLLHRAASRLFNEQERYAIVDRCCWRNESVAPRAGNFLCLSLKAPGGSLVWLIGNAVNVDGLMQMIVEEP